MEKIFLEVLLVIVCGAAAWLGASMKKIYKEKADNEEKEAVANTAVLFVEQVFTMLHGKEKLDQAMIVAAEMLAARGIKFSKKEMRILIEAAVASFNDAFSEEILLGVSEETE